MTETDLALTNQVWKIVEEYNNDWPMPGITDTPERECLVTQLVDSIRRVKYYELIVSRGDISPNRENPKSPHFDPLRAVVSKKRNGDINEAFWLAFLSVHFGRNIKTGWQLLADVYRGLGNQTRWNWNTVVSQIGEFREWLDEFEATLKSNGKFGNHRKYESCSGSKPRGTGAAIASYINWVGPEHDHLTIIQRTKDSVGDHPGDMFDHLYMNMNVTSFGRMGKFDYLTSLGKLGLANIEPGHAYLKHSTGPLRGIKVLFGDLDIELLDVLLDEFARRLAHPFSMQILEDAICNWQKNPSSYVYFKG